MPWFMQHVVPSIFATSMKNDVKKTEVHRLSRNLKMSERTVDDFWYKTSMATIETIL